MDGQKRCTTCKKMRAFGRVQRTNRRLQFDHRDRSTKTANVAYLLSNARSWQAILAEIEKCDVRCANCHSRRTAAQVNS